ncbi:flavin-containing monooxygenase 5-like isoform X2 [Ptychodera flava]|uniref:flavin-containing monooxygenase 5-like isoform X1 n=1 Tax=Ptychodera flava TaxID=63121 RepID=UPI003969F19C
MSSKRVAIIGAGVSGLVSIKSCLEEGLTPVCFEKSDRIAGLWNYSDIPREGDGGALYECLVTNSSKEMMYFSDFPFKKEYPPYLTPPLVLNYYKDYADHFELHKYIKLKTTVTKVVKSEDFSETGRWIVRTQEEGQAEKQEIFDAIMVCTGIYTKPFIPDCEGLDQFQGEKLHSNEFRRGRDFAGKTVVVVGDSHSAGDVATDSSRHAKKVYLSMRDGTWVVLRMGPGAMTSDQIANKRFNHVIPDSLRQFIVEKIVQSKIDHEKLGLKSSRRMFSGSVMVNDDIHNRIFCGSLKCKPEIQSFSKHGVKFVDGSEVNDLDAVVFATGYNIEFPFIDGSILADNFKDLELYFHVFPPRLEKNTLALIGGVATVGAQGPVFELQARWATRVFKGVASLPDRKPCWKMSGQKGNSLQEIRKTQSFFSSGSISRRNSRSDRCETKVLEGAPY